MCSTMIWPSTTPSPPASCRTEKTTLLHRPGSTICSAVMSVWPPWKPLLTAHAPACWCATTTKKSAARVPSGASGPFLRQVLERLFDSPAKNDTGLAQVGPDFSRQRPRHTPQLCRQARQLPCPCPERRSGHQDQCQPALRHLQRNQCPDAPAVLGKKRCRYKPL